MISVKATAIEYSSRISEREMKIMDITKSPIEKLKEDILDLREKNAEDEMLIRIQQEEILLLKKLIEKKSKGSREMDTTKSQTIENDICLMTLQSKIAYQTEERTRLQDALNFINTEIKELNMCSTTIPKKENGEMDQQIKYLQGKLKTNEEMFKLKEQENITLIKEKDLQIENYCQKIKALEKEHERQLNQMQLDFSTQIERIKTEKQVPINNLKFKKEENKLDQLIEQALRDFEQEQYNHPPPPLKTLSFKNNKVHMKPTTFNNKINQQWYTHKYVPIDAMSWPAPEPLANLKKTSTMSAFTV